MWKTHLLEILALPNLPSRHISAARALTTSSPPSEAQWSAEERSGDLEGSCLTRRDTRCLQQADLSHLAMKHCLNVDCTASCSKKQLSSRDRSNWLISSFFKELHGFELGGVRKYQLLRDRWILIIEFLLLGKKDTSYRCCSLLLSMKGILYVQYFYIAAFPPIRIWIRIDNILYLRKKMDCYFYSARPLCVHFVPNYSHCYSLVFSFSFLLFINVYIIYFYYQGFYFNSYYPVCKLTVDC